MWSQQRRNVYLAAAIAAILACRIPAVVGDDDPRTPALPPAINRSADDWNRLCDEAVGADAAKASEAARALRAAGIQGWQEFRRRHQSTIERLAERPACLCDPDSPERRVAMALDKISAQRDAASSGLYWHTDIDAALAAAKHGPKPILTLRLLGRLDDDLSCANSRFFRTTLYSDPELARYLERSFVLHWETVRPVPVITIDFGDGRKMERTITGNSAHYVLDPDGRVIDCLPGLYSAAEFRRRLDATGPAIVATYQEKRPPYRAGQLTTWHHNAMRRIDAAVRGIRAENVAVEPTLPDVNVSIANRRPLEDGELLPNALGETLLAPRPMPEPLSTWAARALTLATPDKPAYKLGMLAASETVAAPTKSVRPAYASWRLPNARRAAPVARGKMVLEMRAVEAVVADDQAYEPDPLLQRALTRPIDPKAEMSMSDASDLVTKPLTSVYPTLDAISNPRPPADVIDPPQSVLQYGVNSVRAATLVITVPPSDDFIAVEADLRRLTERMRDEVRLSVGSLRLIRAKFDSTPAVGVKETSADVRFAAMIDTLERSIADDTVRNEYDLHRKIHAWLAENPNIDVAELNERVYAELFLTPRSDPWLGLAPAEAFPALDNGGLFVKP
jgi:hypothetical protein